MKLAHMGPVGELRMTERKRLLLVAGGKRTWVSTLPAPADWLGQFIFVTYKDRSKDCYLTPYCDLQRVKSMEKEV